MIRVRTRAALLFVALLATDRAAARPVPSLYPGGAPATADSIVLEFPARQARRIGNRSHRLLPQHLVRDIGKECRIHASRIGHEAGAAGAEQSAQPFISFRYHAEKLAFDGGEVEGRAAVPATRVAAEVTRL